MQLSMTRAPVFYANRATIVLLVHRAKRQTVTIISWKQNTLRLDGTVFVAHKLHKHWGPITSLCSIYKNWSSAVRAPHWHTVHNVIYSSRHRRPNASVVVAVAAAVAGTCHAHTVLCQPTVHGAGEWWCTRETRFCNDNQMVTCCLRPRGAFCAWMFAEQTGV